MTHFTAQHGARIGCTKRIVLTGLLLLAAATSPLLSQENFFSRWEARTNATQAKQPPWSSPLIAPYPMLIQDFRADFTRQISPALTTTWNYGDERGLQLVPGFNTEIDFYYPPYIQHNTSFLYKYRLLTANEQHGDYMLSTQIVATIPTGSYSNGSPDASISPTLLGGKGYGRFDVISSLGGTLPTGDTKKLGRSIAWNTTAQYHLGKYLWPELEANATYFVGGPHDGETQNFLTPGFTTSKFRIYPKDARSRLGFVVGAGMQIATSPFHTYNHELAFTGRFVF
jgi:hypothetical protein